MIYAGSHFYMVHLKGARRHCKDTIAFQARLVHKTKRRFIHQEDS